MVDRRPLPGLMIEEQPEAVVKAMLLSGEARGEQDGDGRLESVAMAGVAFCPINRQKRPRWRGQTLRAIILAKWQFSCFNSNDPNREKLLDLWQSDPVSWERADTVLDLIESGLVSDPTGGATHYCTANLWNTDPKPGQTPQWYHRQEIDAQRTHETARIGNHVFAVAP